MKVRRVLVLVLILGLTIVSLRAGKASEPGAEEPEYGGKSLTQWLAALKDGDAATRCDAAKALGSLSSGYLELPVRAAVPALYEAFKDPDGSVRRAAAVSLVRLDRTASPEITRELLAGLADPDPSARGEMAHALECLGPAARDAAPALLRALKDGNSEVRRSAAIALAAVAPDRAKAAIRVLTEAHAAERPFTIEPDVYTIALRGMARAYPKETVAALLKVLHRSGAAHKTAYVLEFIGPAADAAIPDLIAACKGPDMTLRLSAAWALVEIDPGQAPAVVKVLTASLQDSNQYLRAEAAWRLGEIGPLAKDAAPALLQAYRDAKDESNRGTFLKAVAEIGPTARKSLPALIALLKHKKDGGSDYAIGALYWFGPAARAAVPSLVQILDEEVCDQEEHTAAAVALARIDPARAGPAVPVLAATLPKACDDWLELTEALEAIGPAAREAIPALRNAMKKWPPEARPALVKALVRIDVEEARKDVSALRAALRHRKIEERRSGATALGWIGPAARVAVPDLVAALDDPDIRCEAAAALGRIGPAAADAVPSLVRALRHSIVKRDGWRKGKEQDQPTVPAKPSILAALKDPELADICAEARGIGDLEIPITTSMFLERMDHARNPEIRMARMVAVALGQMGPASRETIAVLKAARKAREAEVRLAAACALCRLAPPQATDVLPSLRDALGDRDWTVRAAACSALAQIGPDAREVAPALLRPLQDPVSYVRREAVKALRQVDPDLAAKHGLP